MKHKLLFLLLILQLTLPLTTLADTITVNYITYETNADSMTASITGYTVAPTGDLVLPNTVSWIGGEYTVTSIASGSSSSNGAFYNCTGLTSVTLPDSLTEIGSYAFYYCSSLTSIDLPDSLTEIGRSAFEYCKSLTAIDLPDSLTEIGYMAFNYCSSLTAIDFPDSLTSIGSFAFHSCSSLTAIDLPDNLTEIAYRAFRYCYSLTAIDLPDSLTEIGERAFESCSSLTSIDLPESLKIIGSSAFSGCSKLATVQFNESLVAIGVDAFNNCPGVTTSTLEGDGYTFQTFNNMATITGYQSTPFGEYTIPSTITVDENEYYVTSIYSSVFKECTYITSLILPEYLIYIDSYAFEGCTNLTSIDFPDSLTKIGSYAFYNCSSITAIDLPDNLTEIGYMAFFYCSKLTDIKVNWETPLTVTSSYVFYSFSTATLSVPVGTLEAYKADSYWGQFSNIVEVTVPIFIELSIGENGYITVGDNNYSEYTEIEISSGDNFTFTVVANDGYEIETVLLENVDITAELVDGSYTISNIVADATISATFTEIPVYTIELNIGDNGYIAVNDNKYDDSVEIEITEGNDFTFTVVPNDEYEIETVLLDNVDVTTELVDGSYTISEITADAAISATFSEIPIYTIGLNIGNNGYIAVGSNNYSENTEVERTEGDNFTFTVIANDGYEISTVLLDNVDITDELVDGSYTISAVTADASITATFTPLYTIGLIIGNNGYITVSDNNYNSNTEFVISEGDNFTFTVVPNDGYEISTVLLDNVDITAELVDGSYTISNITADASISSTFTPLYTIGLTIGDNGYITVGDNNYNSNTEFVISEGDNFTFTVVPNDGYEISTVLLDNVDITAELVDGSYTISEVTADATISAKFKPLYTVELIIGDNGYITVNNNNYNEYTEFEISEDDDFIFTVVANDGYEISAVLLNNVNITNKLVNGSYTISSIIADATISVTFTPLYTVGLTIGDNGYIAVNDNSYSYYTEIEISEGDDFTFTVVPNDGYEIGAVLLDNVDITAELMDGSYTISNVTANATISVTFTEIPAPTYTIGLTIGDNGYIAVNDNSYSYYTEIETSEGDNFTFTVVPNDGYEISAVLLDNVDITAELVDGNYTISNITADASISATFAEIPTSVSATTSNIKVYTVDGMLIVSGAVDGVAITVYNLNGAKVADGVVFDGTAQVELPITNGAYIAFVGSQPYKVIR